MHEDVKTITLDEQAYARLKAWKQGSNESFSQVVKRVVPEPGTLGAFLNFTEARRTGELSGNEKLEQTVSERTPVKTEPWT